MGCCKTLQKNKFQKYCQLNSIGNETWNTFYANVFRKNLSQFTVVLLSFSWISSGFEESLAILVLRNWSNLRITEVYRCLKNWQFCRESRSWNFAIKLYNYLFICVICIWFVFKGKKLVNKLEWGWVSHGMEKKLWH